VFDSDWIGMNEWMVDNDDDDNKGGGGGMDSHRAIRSDNAELLRM
jgi:hypothetical protein